MMSEEDKEMLRESKKCDNCLQWHKYCKAECCLTVFLNLRPDALKDKRSFLDFRMIIDFDKRWYYRLRGINYVHGVLRFPKKDCRVVGNEVIFMRKCELLTEDLKCRGHPDKKPRICRTLNVETSKLEGRGYRVTPHCLLKFKRMEDEKDEKEVQGQQGAGE